MLGNVPELWELTLTAMKLGAVFRPATTLLAAADLQDRIERGGIRHVIAAEYWIGLHGRRRALEHQLARAKHAWSSFFAPWDAGATIFAFQLRRLRSEVRPRRAREPPCDHALCAADRMADAHPGFVFCRERFTSHKRVRRFEFCQLRKDDLRKDPPRALSAAEHRTRG